MVAARQSRHVPPPQHKDSQTIRLSGPQLLYVLDGPIRANRLISANRFRDPKLNPFFANRASGHKKIANRRFEAFRANRSNVMKIRVFLRIDSRESIPATRPDLSSM